MVEYKVLRYTRKNKLVEVGTVEPSNPKSAKKKSEVIMASGSRMLIVPNSHTHEFRSKG